MSAVAGTCAKEDCTAAVTGRCLESFASPQECPHFSARAAGGEQPETPSVEEAQTHRTSGPGRRFHPGLELGLKEVLPVTRARYARLVGILGPSNAGKTCLLTSLYLQATHGLLLPEFRFAGSQTIQGFELRALRGLEHRAQMIAVKPAGRLGQLLSDSPDRFGAFCARYRAAPGAWW